MPAIFNLGTKPWRAAAAVALCVAGLARPGGAQHYQPFGEFAYDYDLQLFAPAMLAEECDDPIVRKGIYFTYDRSYINMTRPERPAGTFPLQPPVLLPPEPQVIGGVPIQTFGNIYAPFDLASPFGDPMGDTFHYGDFTWGNRYDFGYLRDEHTGWGMTVWDVQSPGVTQTVEMVDRNGVELITIDDLDTEDRLVGPLANSVNTANLWSVELNRLFRFTRYGPHGGVFEPFLGIRYAQFDDHYLRTTAEIALDGIRNSAGDLLIPANRYTHHLQTWAKRRNDMIGGQVGLRAYLHRGRWLLSSEIRMFGLQNYQTLRRRDRLEQTITPIDEDGALVVDETSNNIAETTTEYNVDDFVFGGDLRVEVAFEITRAIAIRGGLEVMDYAVGIGRGVDPSNREDLILAGATFGFTVNR